MILRSPSRDVSYPVARPIVDAMMGGAGASLLLDFTTGVADPRLTVSGGANGTRINAAGVLVAANAPRFDYNPSTLSALGLLVEEARTNVLLNSLLNGAALSTQSVTVTAQAYTLSFYGTGSVTLSGTSTGTVTGTGAYPARVTSTFTPTAGSLTLTVSGNVQFAQLEAGSFATSFTPTGASAVTRTADSVTMTGANFSQWFNQSTGTLYTEFDIPTLYTTGTSTAASLDDGTSANTIASRTNGAHTAIGVDALIASTALTGLDVSTVGTVSAGAVLKHAIAWSSGDSNTAAGGTLGAGSTTTFSTGAFTTLNIGRNRATAGILNGHIKRIRYFPSRLPNAALQSLTT